MPAAVPKDVLMEIMDKLHVCVYIADENGSLIYINNAAASLDCLDKERDLGRQVEDIWRANAFEERPSPTVDSLKNGKIHYCENLEWRLTDGSRVNAITSSYPIVREGGRIKGVFTLAENIDGLKRRLLKQGAFKRKLFYRLRRDSLKNGTDYTLDDIIGRSEAMVHAVSLARRLASRRLPVLLYGETGTGKELFAQGIHNASACAAGPFVAVNCAAIPETLLESMLFGVVKGAYTGAEDKEGLFEKAEGGSLFLDEINSMPLALQAKLLRAIEEKRIRRLGDNKTRKINCRVISAANREPLAAIAVGHLREDLYYRLAAGVIWIAPLRERLDDLEPLVDYFISKLNEELETVIVGPSADLLSFFRGCQWPGNVRELANIITNAMIMANDSDVLLDVEHLPYPARGRLGFRQDLKASARAEGGQSSGHGWDRLMALSADKNLDQAVDAYEEKLIRLALAAARGRTGRAAELLGVSRQSLYVKLKKYRLNKSDYS